ncbi:MAG: dihydroxyacetone kinase subunit DhaL [Planctomycetaceae bacterium]|nr:dihydroxyacetone kinase subunit DhaL [Planctomycetaceae bacterium]
MTLTREKFIRMLQAAATTIESNVTYLNQLDAATGDGDHGTSIVKAIRAVVKTMAEATPDQTLKEMLFQSGWAAMGEDCGSTSTLLGSLFMGMSEAATSDELDFETVKSVFHHGLTNITRQTKAKVGDKTLMDALIPAVEALQKAADLPSAFEAAAKAAATGAESTKGLVAKFGRAKNLGERSIGHLDAGAVSMAMIFDAFSKNFP